MSKPQCTIFIVQSTSDDLFPRSTMRRMKTVIEMLVDVNWYAPVILVGTSSQYDMDVKIIRHVHVHCSITIRIGEF